MKTHNWGTLDPFFESGSVLGRKVANIGFIKALLEADPFAGYYFFLGSEEYLLQQEQTCARMFPRLYERGAFTFALSSQLPRFCETTTFGAFHLADPVKYFAQVARVRNVFSRTIFPITAVTHSLSYERYVPAFLEHLWAGTSSRDRIVVTSESARQMMQATYAMLQERYTCESTACSPACALVPLGVDADFLARFDNQAEVAKRRNETRAALSIAQDSLVLLCLARISVDSKMDLHPLLQALKRAQLLGIAKDSCTLVLAGWANDDSPLPELLQSLAAQMGIHLVLRVRPTTEECMDLYAAADIFVSPSDNIQETFGLTIAEAGGAGLPVIASAFDGYRDIVEHEVTGILVPTLGFAGSTETNIVAGVWYDNQYHLKLAQQAVVDVPELAKAIARLGADADARTRMGRAAREQVLQRFSWQTVIKQYCTLWQELAAQPVSDEEEQRLRGAVHPVSPDFARSFKNHFTQVLDEETAASMTVCMTPQGDAVYRGHLPPLRYAGVELMLPEEVIKPFLLAARKPVSGAVLLRRAAELTAHPHAGVAAERAAFLFLWALKHDYIERIQ